MKCLVLLLIQGIVLAHSCDPSRNFRDENGECCKMCEPGTKTSGAFDCKRPTCVPCEDGEYQDEYSRSDRCKRQPYCDPNFHQERLHPVTTLAISVCVCMKGFQCASGSCSTCVKTTCPPGSRLQREETGSRSTTCVSCPEGTFSNVSLSETCYPWTRCEVEKAEGTSTTDRVCDNISRNRTVLGVLLVLLPAAAIGLCIFIIYKKGKNQGLCDKMRPKLKELQKENTDLEAGAEAGPLIAPPTDQAEVSEEAQDLPEVREAQDIPEVREAQDLSEAREAEEDDESVETPPTTPVQVTDGLRIIAQEEGKAEVLSQPESPQAILTSPIMSTP